MPLRPDGRRCSLRPAGPLEPFGETQFVSVGVNEMEISLAPLGVTRRGLGRKPCCDRQTVDRVDVGDVDDHPPPAASAPLRVGEHQVQELVSHSETHEVRVGRSVGHIESQRSVESERSRHIRDVQRDRGAKGKRFYQFTAIDDCTRLRVLRAYPRCNQRTAIQFLDYFLAKLPFRVEVIQTDNGGEFGSQFHVHVLDRGIRHVYIKPATPRLNGKVERSHRIDEEEFYRMLDGVVVDDTDLFNDRLQEWEDFYNFNRPHGGLDGQTPYERLRHKTQNPM